MFCFIKKCVILCGILIKGRLLIMKVNKILAFMFILELCIIPLQGCGAKSITADSTETQETQAQIDDAYGKGLSFTYNDYADNVLSLSYNLKQNADGSWQGIMSALRSWWMMSHCPKGRASSARRSTSSSSIMPMDFSIIFCMKLI